MPDSRVSVVIPSRNEGANLPYTVHWVLENSAHPDFEVVIVDDGSTDDSLAQVDRHFGSDGRVRVVEGERRGPGRARNLGAHEADGEIVVFLDGHCYTPPGWLPALVSPLADPEVGLVGCAFTDLRRANSGIGVGCTWSHPVLALEWLERQTDDVYPVPLLPGGCQAMRKADFESFGRYDPGMSHIGSEGEEQSLRCWLMGYSVLVEPRVLVHHLFRDRPPYEVLPGELIYNRLRTALLHFKPERVTRVFDALKGMPHFAEQLTALFESDVMAQRARWLERRERSDDWFCERFGIPI